MITELITAGICASLGATLYGLYRRLRVRWSAPSYAIPFTSDTICAMDDLVREALDDTLISSQSVTDRKIISVALLEANPESGEAMLRFLSSEDHRQYNAWLVRHLLRELAKPQR